VSRLPKEHNEGRYLSKVVDEPVRLYYVALLFSAEPNSSQDKADAPVGETRMIKKVVLRRLHPKTWCFPPILLACDSHY